MTAAHWDHDIHGPVIEIWPDNSQTLDPDCDCPSDCQGCEDEGVVRHLADADGFPATFAPPARPKPTRED